MPLDFLDVLPTELGLNEFGCVYIDGCTGPGHCGVSQKWNQLAHFPGVWRNLALGWSIAICSEDFSAPVLTAGSKKQVEQVIRALSARPAASICHDDEDEEARELQLCTTSSTFRHPFHAYHLAPLTERESCNAGVIAPVDFG